MRAGWSMAALSAAACAGCGQLGFPSSGGGAGDPDGARADAAGAGADAPTVPRRDRDVTGDGQADLVVGGADGIRVFAGGAPFAPASAADAVSTLVADSTEPITNLVALGDVSGDGVADLFFTTTRQGAMWLHRVDGPVAAGAAPWSASASSTELVSVDPSARVTSSLGDLTGDGAADLAVVVGGFNGAVMVFADGELAGPAYASYKLPTAGHEPSAPARLRDLTGDGQPDLVIGNRYRDPSARGAVDVVPGPLAAGDRSAAQVDTDPAIIRLRSPTDNDLLGAGVGVTDVDGDGQADLVVGADQADTGGLDGGHTLVVLGPLPTGTSDPSTVARVRVLGDAGAQNGTRVLTGFDGDGDGAPDLVSVEWCGPGCSGALVGVGAPRLDRTYLAAEVSYRFGGDQNGDHFGVVAAVVGDVDGDGADDLAVGVARANPASGVVYLLRGGRALPATGSASSVADRVITGGAGFGGMIIGTD